MKVLYIIRGLPGTGKSTLARKLTNIVCEADSYFTDENGDYKFDPTKLREAHESCRIMCRMNMLAGEDTIAVSNTSVKKWESKVYRDLAQEFGYCAIEVVMKTWLGSDHNVPESTIERMVRDWED